MWSRANHCVAGWQSAQTTASTLVGEETQRTYVKYVPRVPYPNRAGIALAKSFMEKTEPNVRPLSVDDQLDGSIVRSLEQSGFFNSLYSGK